MNFNVFTSSFIINAVAVLVQLLISILLARALGLEEFGVFTLVFSYSIILSVLALLGLPTFLVRELSNDASVEGRVLAASYFYYSLFVASLALGFLVSIIQVCLNFDFFSKVRVYQEVVICLIMFKVFAEILTGALMGLGMVVRAQFYQLLVPLLIPLVGTLFFVFVSKNEVSVHAILALHASGYVLSCALGLAGLSGNRILNLGRGLNIQWGAWGRSCLPLLGVNLMASLQQNLVFVILGSILAPGDLGLYRVAERLAAVTQFPRRSLERVVAQSVAKYWSKGDIPSLLRLLVTVCKFESIFSLFAFLVFFAFGQKIILVLFGQEFSGSLDLLLVLCFSYAVSSMFGFSGTVLTMTNNAGAIVAALSKVLFGYIILLLIFAQGFGVFACAIVTGLAIISTQVILWVSALKRTGINPSPYMSRITLTNS